MEDSSSGMTEKMVTQMLDDIIATTAASSIEAGVEGGGGGGGGEESSSSFNQIQSQCQGQGRSETEERKVRGQEEEAKEPRNSGASKDGAADNDEDLTEYYKYPSLGI